MVIGDSYLSHLWLFNPFSTNVLLLNPLKTSENWRFSDIFRAFRSGTLVENGSSRYFLLVRIKSMQGEFLDWKQVGLFIEHSRLKVFIKISRFLLSVVKLESPISIVFFHTRKLAHQDFLIGYQWNIYQYHLIPFIENSNNMT